MKRILYACLSILLMPALSYAKAPIIYGEDDRKDYAEASLAKQKLSNSIVSLWTLGSLAKDKNDVYYLATRTLENAQGLCKTEKFSQQLSGAFCSGSLVGEDLILTAGHCITDQESCNSSAIVFGFNETEVKKSRTFNNGGRTYIATASSNIYRCTKIIKRALDKNDYALIKLDRKVAGHKPLVLERTATVKANDKVFVIGHPIGSTLKVTDNAKVRSVGQTSFRADLDTFGGNSGSAVFSEKTNKIIGILVSGDTDFVNTSKGCKVYNKVSQNAGRGEEVNFITPVLSLIPEAGAEKSVGTKAASMPVNPNVNINKVEAKSISEISFE